jgi:type IV pilus assembly protein PilM
MMQEILLPEHIGGYYLFAKRIAGIEITATDVYVTYVHVQGRTISIKNCIQAPIERDNGQDELERTARALKAATADIASAEYHVALSSTHVVFKHIKVPFTDRQKIQKIIEFEVEPLLPFAVSDAIIDFLITKYIPEEQSASVLVAAVQKQYIEQQLALFSAAGLQPAVITIDLLRLYGLYLKNPQYASLRGSVALLDIGFQTSKIAYIVDGELRFVRTLPVGTAQIAKNMAQQLHISANDTFDELMRFGFEKADAPEYTDALNKACSTFIGQIQFSLQSFTAQASQQQPIEQLLLLGSGATIQGIAPWMSEHMELPTALFNIDETLAAEQISMTDMAHIPLTHCISTATALPDIRTQDINLRQKEFAQATTGLLIKQLATAGILLVATFALLLVHDYIQVRKLSNEVIASKREAVNALRSRFKDLSSGNNIDSLLDDAKKQIEVEEKLWSPFSASSRNSFLFYLLELTNIYNQKSLGLIIDRIVLDQDKRIMRLKGQVKDYPALTELEQELRQSGLFRTVPRPDYEAFDMELPFADNLNKEMR